MPPVVVLPAPFARGARRSPRYDDEVEAVDGGEAVPA